MMMQYLCRFCGKKYHNGNLHLLLNKVSGVVPQWRSAQLGPHFEKID